MKRRLHITLLFVAGFLGWLVVFSVASAADYSLSFDGVNDYIEIPDDDALDLTQDASVEFWFKKDSAADDWIMPIGKIGDDDATQPWSIWMDDQTGNQNIHLFMGDGTTIDSVDTSNMIYQNNNQWTHVVVTWEKTSDTTLKVSVYVNGTDAGELSNQNIIDDLTLGYTNTNPVVIGAAYTASNRTYWFDGQIDDVRIYSRVLSATEVTDHYNGTYSNEANLVAHWRFNEGSGTTAPDSSGNGHDGTIYGATWIAASVAAAGGGSALPVAYRPEVTLEFPKGGEIFKDTIEIKYKAIDQNNVGGPPRFALGDDAVSLFYSDDNGESWFLIEKGLPREGTYTWEVKDLLKESILYTVKVLAQDRIGETAEAISGGFTVDRTPPVFDISVEPPFSRGENVTITLKANEPLLESPKVIVRQRNYADIQVFVSGEGDTWSGAYEVRSAADGTAKITVEGKDLVGNTGMIIRKGGFFNVGLKPPPSPVVTSPLDNDVVDEPFINIEGRVREDIKAVVIVNGERAKEVSPDKKGNFIIENIELSKTIDHGVNVIQILAEDIGGNLSEPITLNIKYNVLPKLKITEPTGEDTLRRTTTIQILATDKNADELTFLIEISADNGKTWQEITKGLKKPLYEWNTREFPDGKYKLRITADDGTGKVAAESPQFLVENFLPVFSFHDPKKTLFTNKNSITIGGLVGSPSRRKESERENIIGIEYSLDQGENWFAIKAKDGNFDSPREEFSIKLSNLKEGSYEVLVRAEDVLGLIGKIKKIIVVDFGPPPQPRIIVPVSGAVFSDQEDLDSEKAGVQINLAGSAEVNNQIIIINSDVTYEGLSDNAGNFDVEVTLRKHGENLFRVSAVDPAGNKSKKVTELNIVYNNPPDLKFLWPRINGGLNHKAEVVFEIRDRDLDAIKESSLSYRKVGGARKVLTRNMKSNTFAWDVGGFSEGYYELILEANDGVSKNSISRRFIIDNTGPTISFESLKKNVFTKSFILEMQGRATDNFSGVEYVEYSVVSSGREGPSSEDWFKTTITQGYRQKQASFSIKQPLDLADGIYNVRFRGTDVSGNVSKMSDPQEIVIDTNPPRIGSYTLSSGLLTLFPDGESFKIPSGSIVMFMISLERDTKEAVLQVGNETIPLIKNLGLWEADLIFSDIGTSTLLISAEDAFGNKTENKDIGTVEVVEKGKIISQETNKPVEGVKATILIFDEERQSWIPWQAEPYGLENPIFTDKNGEYAFLLPSGEYQISLQKTGFKRLKSSTFKLLNPGFVTFRFEVEPRKGIRGFFEDVLEKITF